MAGYDLSDVPTIELDENEHSALLGEEADSIQSDLMSEAVICVDEIDNVVGSDSKIATHHNVGQLHRAFSVLLFNSEGKLLLQRRAEDKVTFPGIWANSCCSHPLHCDSELEETNALGVKRAAIRKLEQELGISPAQISIDDFHFITNMRYSSRMNASWIEREIDHILLIKADVEINPNPNEVSEIAWVDQQQLEEWLIDEEGTKGVIAPWFRCIAARIMTDEWWTAAGDADACKLLADDIIHDMGDISHMLPNAEGSDLFTAIAEVKPFIENRIERALTHTSSERLSNAMMHLINGGGKRMRATLPWLVAKAVGDTHSGLLDVGAAIETIHNFTLVHDDIMDDDDIRRGLPAVHIAYDLPTAINAGDAMLAIAFEAMVVADGIDCNDLPFLVKRIGRMVRRVSEGQQLDLEFETRDHEVTEDEYIEMIRGKTAVMFLTCGEIGAYLSGADEETVQCMHDWGLAVGLCFQLMDDLLDIQSSTEELGKPAGSDIAQGKRTLMVIHALKQDDCPEKQTLLNVLGKEEEASAEQVSAGIDALQKLGSIDYGRQRAEEYHAQAHLLLDRIPQTPALMALRELTDLQLKRLN
ncbi:MAG: isopentenyl-diphosphate delta-isomerase [Euryarchaeota archaeon]|nr:isopentenyl-diphosphate delta-isomerase [Euryarchaeota archaeon]